MDDYWALCFDENNLLLDHLNALIDQNFNGNYFTEQHTVKNLFLYHSRWHSLPILCHRFQWL